MCGRRVAWVFESDQDIAWLQGLLDDSLVAAGAHLKSIASDDRHHRPHQVVTALAAGEVHHLPVATVTADGRPLVSMVDGQLVRARLCFSSDGSSTKMRHLAHRPAVSAVHARGDALAFSVHGTASLHRPGSDWFEQLEQVFVAQYQSSPKEWCDDPVFAVVEPTFALAYAADASRWAVA